MTNVLVPLAQGCEELEAITIIDLLRRANVKVTTASLDNKLVTASRGTVLIADTPLDDVLDQSFNMIVLPGGLPGADNLNNDARIKQLLLDTYAAGHYIAAICAAPKILANINLLDKKQSTCYPGTLKALDLENVKETGKPIEIDGQIITSRGPGTAMDFALQLIELLVGKTKRDDVETGLVR